MEGLQSNSTWALIFYFNFEREAAEEQTNLQTIARAKAKTFSDEMFSAAFVDSLDPVISVRMGRLKAWSSMFVSISDKLMCCSKNSSFFPGMVSEGNYFMRKFWWVFNVCCLMARWAVARGDILFCHCQALCHGPRPVMWHRNLFWESWIRRGSAF